MALTSYQICVIATRQSIVALANLLEHPEAACMHVKALKTPKKNTPKKGTIEMRVGEKTLKTVSSLGSTYPLSALSYISKEDQEVKRKIKGSKLTTKSYS